MNPLVPDFSAARILVAGDVMLDRYWHGATTRISPEAPVPVVKMEGREDRPGGAANVAFSLAALGSQVRLIGLIGEDEAGEILDTILRAAGVETTLIPIAEAPTITKLRVVSRGQQLLRLDVEENLAQHVPEAFNRCFQDLLEGCNAIVLSDYAKGTLEHVEALIAHARAAGIPVLVDPKMSDPARYRGATLMTPNLAELEAMVGPCADEEALLEKGCQLIAQLDHQALLVTRGAQGMTLIQPDERPHHLPTHAREVYDVTGAGDTVISVLAACLAVGLRLEEGTRLSNLAAGLAVARQGTVTVNSAELRRAAGVAASQTQGVVTEDELLFAIDAARTVGEKLVMTNGCFDILHAGHVSYLKKARSLGDRLIVAVNDDASTRSLKGAGRPVNSLSRRMAVLASMECVDWVVSFSELTPERLVCRVLPDLLVKGADYSPNEIAGAACVRANGGDVQVIELVEGVSTTAILNSWKNPQG